MMMRSLRLEDPGGFGISDPTQNIEDGDVHGCLLSKSDHFLSRTPMQKRLEFRRTQ